MRIEGCWPLPPLARLTHSFIAAVTVALGVLSCMSLAQAQGLGDLAVAPTRVVMEGRTRSAQVSLLNKGTDTAVYRISIINMQMSESGEYRRVEETGTAGGFADSLVRFAPRQVELQPGKSQTVRIILRKPPGLQEGEYRSHILFQAVPDPQTGQSVEMQTTDEGMSIRLVVVPAITIPLIVRHGELSASASISDIVLSRGDAKNDGQPMVSFSINRSGARSLFGDVSITYRSADGREEFVIGQINQLAVYTPNSRRRISLPLRVPVHVTLSGGRLRVEYRARPDDGGGTIAFADQAVP